jgi:hypothetical protein
MALRELRSATGVHLEDMAVLIAHLRSDPRTAELVGDVEAASTALKTQYETWNTQHHAVKETRSGLANIEEALHSAVRVAHLAVLNEVRNNRRDPKFLTYFPRGLDGIFSAAYADELHAVRSLAERCAQDPSPKIQEQASVLRAAADQMSAALDRRTEAMLAESVSYGQLQVEKLHAVDACRRTSHRLTELYPAERDRVRSFFRQMRRRARPTAPATGDPEPAAEAPATAASPPPGAPAPVTPALVLTSAAADG